MSLKYTLMPLYVLSLGQGLCTTDGHNIFRELIPIIMMIYSLLFVQPSRFFYSGFLNLCRLLLRLDLQIRHLNSIRRRRRAN